MKSVEQIFFRFGKSISVAVILVVTVIAYSNSLNCSFQLDDNHLILNNDNIKNIPFYLDFKKYLPPGLTRDLTYFTFAINYAIGKYDVTGYHLVNLAIHVLNSLLVFGIVLLLLFNQNENKSKKLLIALFASLIFALHPVQTNGVTYIAQRLSSMATLFYMATIFFFVLARTNTLLNYGRSIIWCYYGIALFFFLAGLHTKEIIASAPIAALLIEFLFFRGKVKNSNIVLISVSLPIIVFGVIYFTYFGGLPTQDYAVDRISYIATQFNVLVRYFKIYFLPTDLQLYYDPMIASFSELKTILSALLIACVFGAGIYFSMKDKIIGFSLLWFFITQFLESSIFPLQFVIFEYRLYPTTLSYGLLISYLGFKLIKNDKYALILLSGYMLVLLIGTYNRNKAWQTEESLWVDNSRKAPKNAEVWNAVGISYNKNKKYSEAVKALTKAIELNPKYSTAYVHRGVSYQALGNYNKALADVDKAIELDSNYALAYNNKGSVLQTMHFYEPAIDCFEKAVKIRPKFHSAWNNLSIAYQGKGKFDKALEAANTAVQLENNNGHYFNNRGNIYFAVNKLDLAAKDFKTTIELMPGYANGYNNLGTVYLAWNDYARAQILFKEAILRDANYADPYFNRAYIFYMNNQLDFALDEIKRCLIIDPYHVNAVNLYKRIYSR